MIDQEGSDQKEFMFLKYVLCSPHSVCHWRYGFEDSICTVICKIIVVGNNCRLRSEIIHGYKRVVKSDSVCMTWGLLAAQMVLSIYHLTDYKIVKMSASWVVRKWRKCNVQIRDGRVWFCVDWIHPYNIWSTHCECENPNVDALQASTVMWAVISLTIMASYPAGTAPIKKEFLILRNTQPSVYDDDAAEGSKRPPGSRANDDGATETRKQKKAQNG